MDDVTGLHFTQFAAELKAMEDLHGRKNHDYANVHPLSNLQACERMGVPAWKGVVIRLQDKMARLEGFAQRGILEVPGELITDTLYDMAVYAILCKMLYDDASAKGM